jgi:uncharacterized protein
MQADATPPAAYERRGGTVLACTAPSSSYQRVLELAPNGFIRHYPNLWETEQDLDP